MAKRKIDYQELVDLYNSGLYCAEIARKTGLHPATVSKVLKKCGIETGRGNGGVARNNAKRSEASKTEPKPSIAKKLDGKFDILQRTGMHTYILKCKECSCVFERSVSHKHCVTCENCKRLERDRKWWAAEKVQPRLPLSFSESKKEAVIIKKECVYCGMTFSCRSTQHIKKFCSDKCRLKFNRKIAVRSRRNAPTGGSFRPTWQNLYKRGETTCYLCGREVDPNDYRIVNGYFIAGERYPSVDHVVPLAKGGLDSYENAKIACCLCNALKSDKLLEVVA